LVEVPVHARHVLSVLLGDAVEEELLILVAAAGVA